jgi:hypothetical protein
MEQVEMAVDGLRKAAMACSMDGDDAMEDLAQSWEEAIHQVVPSSSPVDIAKDSNFFLMWGTLFRQYGLKCIHRWIRQVRGVESLKEMEKLWLNHERMWQAGCELAIATWSDDAAKYTQAFFDVKSAKGEVVPLSSRQAVTSWLEHNERAIRGMLAAFQQIQRRAITATLNDVREYDESSIFGKLERLMFLSMKKTRE